MLGYKTCFLTKNPASKNFTLSARLGSPDFGGGQSSENESLPRVSDIVMLVSFKKYQDCKPLSNLNFPINSTSFDNEMNFSLFLILDCGLLDLLRAYSCPTESILSKLDDSNASKYDPYAYQLLLDDIC